MLTDNWSPTSKANVPLTARRKLGRRGLRQREAKPLYYNEQANQGTAWARRRCITSNGTVASNTSRRIHRDECRQ